MMRGMRKLVVCSFCRIFCEDECHGFRGDQNVSEIEGHKFLPFQPLFAEVANLMFMASFFSDVIKSQLHFYILIKF